MKTLKEIFFVVVAMALSAFGLTSCDENMTIDIDGPEIEFNFNYTDLRSAESGYVLVAQSDTISGTDIQAYLASEGQDYASIISSATMKSGKLTLSDGRTFAGVDSIQIRYKIVGNDTEFILTEAGASSTVTDSLLFDEVNVTKEEVFELISNDIVASLYAIYDPTDPDFNCFQEGVSFTFTAKTVLSVKLAALASGFSLE